MCHADCISSSAPLHPPSSFPLAHTSASPYTTLAPTRLLNASYGPSAECGRYQTRRAGSVARIGNRHVPQPPFASMTRLTCRQYTVPKQISEAAYVTGCREGQDCADAPLALARGAPDAHAVVDGANGKGAECVHAAASETCM